MVKVFATIAAFFVATALAVRYRRAQAMTAPVGYVPQPAPIPSSYYVPQVGANAGAMTGGMLGSQIGNTLYPGAGALTGLVGSKVGNSADRIASGDSSAGDFVQVALPIVPGIGDAVDFIGGIF